MKDWKELDRRDLDKLYGKVELRFWQDQVNYELSDWMESKASIDKIKSLIKKGVRYQYQERPLQMNRAFYLYLLEHDLHGKLFESNCVKGSKITGMYQYVEIID
jgi:hypothetical protein